MKKVYVPQPYPVEKEVHVPVKVGVPAPYPGSYDTVILILAFLVFICFITNLNV